jgi:hypothetical protein
VPRRRAAQSLGPPNTELGYEAPKFATLRQLQFFVVRHRVLEVARGQPCALGDSGQHAWAFLLAVMEGEDEVWPTGPRQGAMRP